MAEGIVYLDADDEITSAAARIRNATGTKVALVVPYGSRIATSRMNFRLLSREAVMSNHRLSIVAGDAASRSLAASAGLPAFGSVSEYESALSDTPGDPGRSSDAPPVDLAGAPTPAAPAASPGGAAAAGLAASETVAVIPLAATSPQSPPPVVRKSQRPKRPVLDDTTRVVTAPPVGPSPATRADRVPARETGDADVAALELPPLFGGRVRAPVIAAAALVILALVVAGVGAYVFLPSASITLVPRRDAIPPIVLTVSADPEATAVDVANSVVPATRVDVPVEAARTFTTTGKHVEETTARGSVTFTNYDTSSGVSIPSGSIVSTEGGIRFRTQSTVTLQPAGIIPFEPRSDSANVSAVNKGEDGNVPANTIRVVPQGQNPDLLRVNNPDPTSGGSHTETPEVKQADVDKALAALQVDLSTAFSDAVAAGANAPPDTTLFPDTAELGPITPDIDPQSLVGQAVETFDLRETATGTVIAVDPRPVRTIAESQLVSRVSPNHRLVDGSATIDVGQGTVGEDGQVTFQATASAEQVANVDVAMLPALVKGLTPAQAKTALAPYGDATVRLWPDWVSTVTSIDARLSIDVDAGTTSQSGERSAPSPSPSVIASRRPSKASPSSASSAGPEASAP